MSKVAIIKLNRFKVSRDSRFCDQTDLLTTSHRFNSEEFLAFCDPELELHPDVAGVFKEVPSSDGAWTLELGLPLPIWLPSLDDRTENALTITVNKTHYTLCISNNMSRFHYHDGNDSYHTLTPRIDTYHGHAIVSGIDKNNYEAIEERLRTVASMRFRITSSTAATAFENSIDNCINIFLSATNIVIFASRECSRSPGQIIRNVSRDNIAYLYVLIKGANQVRAKRLMLDGGRLLQTPDTLDAITSTKFREIALGGTPPADIDRLLGEAKSCWHNGDYEFAMLLAVIAAELITTRIIHAKLMMHGISASKLKENQREMTYSWCLNIGLPSLIPAEKLPSRNLIEAVIKGKKKRNELMHTGQFSMSRKETLGLVTDTQEYVCALRNI